MPIMLEVKAKFQYKSIPFIKTKQNNSETTENSKASW